MSDRLNPVLKVAEFSVTTTSNGYFQFSLPSSSLAYPIKAYALNNINYIIHLGFNSQNGSFMGIVTANGVDYVVADMTFPIKVIYAAIN